MSFSYSVVESVDNAGDRFVLTLNLYDYTGVCVFGRARSFITYREYRSTSDYITLKARRLDNMSREAWAIFIRDYDRPFSD